MPIASQHLLSTWRYQNTYKMAICQIIVIMKTGNECYQMALLNCFYYGQTQLICCFSDLSQNHLRWLREEKKKKKWKNRYKIAGNLFYFIFHTNNIYFLGFFWRNCYHQQIGGFEKLQLNQVLPKAVNL